MRGTAHDPVEVSFHPSPAALAAFGLGRLDDEESAAIAGHVSACDPCRSLIEAVPDDSLAALLRASGRSEADDADPGGPGRSAGYERLEKVGEGGMGVVYKARQIGLGRLVALKQVRPEALAGRDGASRFRLEAEAAARLRHPNIVQVFDVGRLDGVPYYAMEYVEGGTLADRLADGPLPPGEAARLVETLARAVEHAHEAGVVHRDLKPGNVLLAPDLASPKICDFGLAKRSGDDLARTTTGAILGTPQYMAPEQAEGGSARVGPAVDIYALGAILYEALVGRPPFSASSTLEALDQLRRSEPEAPRRSRREVPRDLETIALKCLEKAPARRYASARELADDLRRHLDGEPIRARRASAAERLAKWARRRPWQAVSAGLGLLAVAGLVAGTLVHNARLRAEVDRTTRKADEARRERARADAQYRAARDAIRRMVARLDGPEAAARPVPMEVRRGLLEDALAFYDGAVADAAPADPGARLDKASAHVEAASLQFMVGRPADAERTLLRAVALLDALEASRPDDPEVLGVQVACRGKLGTILGALERIDEAAGWLTGAIDRAERRWRAEPASSVAAEAVAWAHHNLGAALSRPGRLADAEPHFRRAEEVRVGLIRDRPDQTSLSQRLAETRINLASIYAQTGRRALAAEEYARAFDGLAPVARDHPELREAQASLADLCLNWGALDLFSGRLDRATARYEEGIRIADGLLGDAPEWRRVRLTASRLHGSLGQALVQSGRHAEAARAHDRAGGLASGLERTYHRVLQAADLARAGEFDRAVAVGEAALALPDASPRPEDLYNMACVAAIASGLAEPSGKRDRAEDYAHRALRWLERARSAGFFRGAPPLALLDEDADLAPLRPRRDFRLFRLDAAFPADPFAPEK